MPKFRSSAVADKYLKGLKGVEIGGAAHNDFFLDTTNVDCSDDMTTRFKEAEVENCGEAMGVDVVAEGDKLPFEDKSFDFVISSHVLEHIWDPLAAMVEWDRVAREYILIIVPNKNKTFDRDKKVTEVSELVERYLSLEDAPPHANDRGHKTIWDPRTFRDFCDYCADQIGLEIVEFLETDDKVGNGMLVLFKCGELNITRFEFKNWNGGVDNA